MPQPPELPFKERQRYRLNSVALGITLGIVLGAGLFLLTWWVILIRTQSVFLNGIHEFLFGYSVSPAGSFVGLLWGVFYGFILGYVIAIVYNQVNRVLESKAALRSRTWAEKIDDAIKPPAEEPEQEKKVGA